MKRSISVMLLGIFLLAGCAAVEPENRTFPMVMGVEYQEPMFQVIYGMPQLPLTTGQDKAEENAAEDTQVRMYEGETLQAAQTRLELSQEKYLDLGHMRVLILGEGLLASQDKTEELLHYLTKMPVLPSNMYLLRTSQMAELMAQNGKEVDSLGDYLADMLEKEQKNTGSHVPQLKDFYNAWYNEEAFPAIPRISVTDGMIHLE